MGKPTFRIVTLGCKLNFAESSHIAHLLRTHGLEEAVEDTAADICILHSCSVTHEADKKNTQALRRLKRENPQALIILIGCFAQLVLNDIKAYNSILQLCDYVIGQHEKFNLHNHVLDLLKNQTGSGIATIIGETVESLTSFDIASSYEDRTRAFLKIQDGCDYHCSYCTIPMARGKSRNTAIEQVVQQSIAILNNGFKEIVLTGVNIGDFGKSTHEQLFDLLKKLETLPITTPYRIRISSCEPNLLTYDIIDFVKNSQHFAPHFHIPLQSGSDAMLKIMRRRYTCADFEKKLDYIVKQIPNAFIGVDCMVGVRGETEEIFKEYVSFLSNQPFSQLHVFTYSERANTPILSFCLPIVPVSERRHRNAILQQISKKHLHDFYIRHEGYAATVLWEGKKTNMENIQKPTLMRGFTENYIRVARPYDANKINTFEQIRIRNSDYTMSEEWNE